MPFSLIARRSISSTSGGGLCTRPKPMDIDAVLFCLKLVARPGFPVVLTLASLIPITNCAIHAAYALADVKVYARA